MRAARAALKACGVPRAHIKTERFSIDADADDADGATSSDDSSDGNDVAEEEPPPIEEAYVVRCALALSHASLDVPRDSSAHGAGATLLEALEAAGYTPASSCRAGACGACALPLLRGRVAYDAGVPASPARREARRRGEALACCARPAPGARRGDALYEGPTLGI
jgi:ferredoxin